jgi:glycosyltransferase involved in cell wall biosynthesis
MIEAPGGVQPRGSVVEPTSLEKSGRAGDLNLRILIATRCVVPIKPGHGGAEIASYELARALTLRGHRVSIVADLESQPRSTERLELIRVDSRVQRQLRRLPGGFARWIVQHVVGNLLATWTVRRLSRQREFDLIHTNGSLSAVLISMSLDRPLVYTEQDAPPWHCRYRHWWERLIRTVVYRTVNVTAHRRADGVAATFDDLGREMVARWGVPASNAIVIPNAADAEAFNPDASRRRRARDAAPNPAANDRPPATRGERRRYGFDSYCLFVGELCSRKAPDLLMRALADAPGVCCVFAGDGLMRGHLEDLASNLGVGDRVAFLGRQSSENLARIYSDADLFVLPSVSDASPLVIAEAMASGTPVLATRIAGVPSLVREGETGLLVDPGDVAGLAEALRSAMGDRYLRDRMGARASVVARETLAWSAIADQYEALYFSILGRSAPVSPLGGDRSAEQPTTDREPASALNLDRG